MLLRALRRTPLSALAAKLPAQQAARPQAFQLTVRGMGGHAGGGGYGSGPYRGLKVPKVESWHQNVATFYGCFMWLWLFYRIKNDGKAFLVSAAAPVRHARREPDRLVPGEPQLESCSCQVACVLPARLRGQPLPPSTPLLVLTFFACADVVRSASRRLAGP